MGTGGLKTGSPLGEAKLALKAVAILKGQGEVAFAGTPNGIGISQVLSIA